MSRLLIIFCCILLSSPVAFGHWRWKQSRRHFSGHRIIGGEDTDISEVPYQAVLLWSNYNFCGAAIISEKFLLTGAHCIVFVFRMLAPEQLSIRVGSSYAKRDGILTKAKETICHPKFDFDSYDYDVCIIELEKPLNFSKNVQAVKIGTAPPNEGQIGLIAGWGTLWENGKEPEKLQSVTVPVTNQTYCEDAYKKISPISERMFCAGSEGKDSCQGDSGGGLVVENNLVGITSTGFGCGLANYPGVYTALTHPEIREFITNITNI